MEPGEEVQRGQALCLSGNTGHTLAPTFTAGSFRDRGR
jgi:hypothetical protein